MMQLPEGHVASGFDARCRTWVVTWVARCVVLLSLSAWRHDSMEGGGALCVPAKGVRPERHKVSPEGYTLAL